jgi:hypothetical protein
MNEAMSGYLKLEVGVGRVKVVVDDADSGTGISRGELFLNEEWSSSPSPFDIRTEGGLNRDVIEGLASEQELERAVIGAEKAEVCSNSRMPDLTDSTLSVSSRNGDWTPHWCLASVHHLDKRPCSREASSVYGMT